MRAVQPPAGAFDGEPGVLRFITAGSVDDGKSTLIGRLLFDSKGLLRDQVAALTTARGAQSALQDGDIDLALVTDGLESEREQGITIDVAYRYFATPRRSFVIADAPGHEQYTRNMVTAASNAEVAIILIDASRLAGGASFIPGADDHAASSRNGRGPHGGHASRSISGHRGHW